MSYISRFLSVILLLFVSILPDAMADKSVVSRVAPSTTTDKNTPKKTERNVAQRGTSERGTSNVAQTRASERNATRTNTDTRRERDTTVNRATSSVRARTTTTPTAVRTSDAQPRSERGVNTRDAASARTATTNASRSAVARTSANIQNRVATTNASRAAANRATGAQTQSRATTARNATRNAATRAGNTVHSRAGVLSRMFSATRKVDTAATKTLTDTIASMEDDKQITDFCKSQYVSCMDNFCNVLDDEQGRCSCSKNLKNYAKSEEALKQANELLQDVAQQIQYIGLTRDEVETLFTQTAAEQAMQGVTDNSQIKTQLDKIYDMMIDVKPGTATTTDVADNGLSLDLDNLLDFTIDSTGFDLLSMFNTTQTSTSISNQRGDQLYKTAAARCRATVLDVCSKQGVDTNIITNAYDLEIDKSCIAYERTLTDGNAEMRQTVRNAQNVLQRARLMVRQQKNTYDLRGCVTALDSCMQDEFVCGADYENCLDPSGKYIVNGAVVVGSTPGQPVTNNNTLAPGYTYDTDHLYATWNYGGKNAWTEDGSLVGYISDTVDGLPTETSEEMSAFLQYKIGYHDGDTDRNYGMCMSVLNKCQDITYTKDGEYIPDNAVVKEYLQRTLTQIKVRQDQLLSAYAESCITDVKSCLTQNSYDTTQNIAINACRQQIVTCMSVTGDAAGEPTPSIISQWVDDVQNGVTEKKLCQRSGGTWQSNGTCSCSSSKGLELSGSACVCSNNGTWDGSKCIVPETLCSEDAIISGCKCNLKTITVNGTTWCVSSSTKSKYDACNSTWNTTTMTCESSTGGDNTGGGNEDDDDTTEETQECELNKEINNCECKHSTITFNGADWCVSEATSDRFELCVNGDISGKWGSDMKCACSGTGVSQNGPYSCKCDDDYVPNGDGGCKLNPYVTEEYKTPMQVQKTVQDQDKTILVVEDTDTGILYANVANNGEEHSAHATDACVIADVANASATVCDTDNTVELHNGSAIAVYANGGRQVTFKFNGQDTNALKIALLNNKLPNSLSWVSQFADDTDYEFKGVYGSDGTTQYYGEDGSATTTTPPSDRTLRALFELGETEDEGGNDSGEGGNEGGEGGETGGEGGSGTQNPDKEEGTLEQWCDEVDGTLNGQYCQTSTGTYWAETATQTCESALTGSIQTNFTEHTNINLCECGSTYWQKYFTTGKPDNNGQCGCLGTFEHTGNFTKHENVYRTICQCPSNTIQIKDSSGAYDDFAEKILTAHNPNMEFSEHEKQLIDIPVVANIARYSALSVNKWFNTDQNGKIITMPCNLYKGGDGYYRCYDVCMTQTELQNICTATSGTLNTDTNRCESCSGYGRTTYGAATLNGVTICECDNWYYMWDRNPSARNTCKCPDGMQPMVSADDIKLATGNQPWGEGIATPTWDNVDKCTLPGTLIVHKNADEAYGSHVPYRWACDTTHGFIESSSFVHSPEITPYKEGDYGDLIDMLKTWNSGKPACTCDTGLDMVYDERLQKYICVNSAAYNSCPTTYNFATRSCPQVTNHRCEETNGIWNGTECECTIGTWRQLNGTWRCYLDSNTEYGQETYIGNLTKLTDFQYQNHKYVLLRDEKTKTCYGADANIAPSNLTYENTCSLDCSFVSKSFGISSNHSIPTELLNGTFCTEGHYYKLKSIVPNQNETAYEPANFLTFNGDVVPYIKISKDSGDFPYQLDIYLNAVEAYNDMHDQDISIGNGVFNAYGPYEECTYSYYSISGYYSDNSLNGNIHSTLKDTAECKAIESQYTLEKDTMFAKYKYDTGSKYSMCLASGGKWDQSYSIPCRCSRYDRPGVILKYVLPEGEQYANNDTPQTCQCDTARGFVQTNTGINPECGCKYDNETPFFIKDQWHCVVINDPVPADDPNNQSTLEPIHTFADVYRLYITLKDTSTGACYVTSGKLYDPDAKNDVFYTRSETQSDGTTRTVRYWTPQYKTGISTDASGEKTPYVSMTHEICCGEKDLSPTCPENLTQGDNLTKLYINAYKYDSNTGEYNKVTDENNIPRLTYNGQDVDYINLRTTLPPDNLFQVAQLPMKYGLPYKWRGGVLFSQKEDVRYTASNEMASWKYDSDWATLRGTLSSNRILNAQFSHSTNYDKCITTGGQICNDYDYNNIDTICPAENTSSPFVNKQMTMSDNFCSCPAGSEDDGWTCKPVAECPPNSLTCAPMAFCDANGKKTDDCTCPKDTELMSIPGTADQYCYTEEMKQNYNTCVPYGQWNIEEKSCFCNEKYGLIPTTNGLSCTCDTANGWSDVGIPGTCRSHAMYCSIWSSRPEYITKCHNGEYEGCVAANVPETNQKTCVSSISYKSGLSYADTCRNSGGSIYTDADGYITCNCGTVDLDQDGVYDPMEIDPKTGECIPYTFEEWCTNGSGHASGTYSDDGLGVCTIDHTTQSTGTSWPFGYTHLTYRIENENPLSTCQAQGGLFNRVEYKNNIVTNPIYNMTTCTCSGNSGAHSVAQRDANGNCMCEPTFVRDITKPTDCVCPSGTTMRKNHALRSMILANINAGEYIGYNLDSYIGTNDLPVYMYNNGKKMLDSDGMPIDMKCVLAKDNQGYYCQASCVPNTIFAQSCAISGNGQYDPDTKTCQCSAVGFTSVTSDNTELPVCACNTTRGFESDGKGGCTCREDTEYNAEVNACVPIGSTCSAELTAQLKDSYQYAACKCDVARGYEEIGVYGADLIEGSDGYRAVWTRHFENAQATYRCGCSHGVPEFNETLGLQMCVQKPYDNNARLACVMSGGDYYGTNFNGDYCTANMADTTGCHYSCGCASNYGMLSAIDSNGYEICQCNSERGFVLKEDWLSDAAYQKALIDTYGDRSAASGHLDACGTCSNGKEHWSGIFPDITGASNSTGTQCVSSVDTIRQSLCTQSGGTWNENGSPRKCTCTQAGTAHISDVFSDHSADMCIHWNAVNCLHDESKIDINNPQSWTNSYTPEVGEYLCNADQCDTIKEFLQDLMGDAYLDVNPNTGWDYQACKNGTKRCFTDDAIGDGKGVIATGGHCVLSGREIELIQPNN